jgi:hypothetical protein
MPKFRVTYGPFEIDAENEDEAKAIATKMLETSRLSEPGDRANVTVERIAHPSRSEGYISEGVRRKPRE